MSFSVVFGLVTSFFQKWSASKLSGFYIFLENDSTNLRQIHFQGLGENHNLLCKRCTGPLN